MTSQILSADPLFLFACRILSLRHGDRQACDALIGASQGSGEVSWLANSLLQGIDRKFRTAGGVSTLGGFMNGKSNEGASKPKHNAAIAKPNTPAILMPGADNHAAFASFVERHRVPLIGFLYRLVGSTMAAEQIAADIFVSLYRSAGDRLQAPDCVLSMYRLAADLGLKYARAHRDASTIHTGSQQEPIADAVWKLPQQEQVGVLLHKYQGLKSAQIAQVLQTSEPEIKTLLSHAYEMLHRRLKGRLA
jgi:DNA-directed RNA polymerase specialized sigma24 family protein